MTDTTMEFAVRDGYREIKFNGALLGQSSSKRPYHWRWTDLNLYRTEGGTYILEKIGASRVTHIPECPTADDLPRFQEVYPGHDPDEDEFQYHECVPEFFDFPALRVERDRPWIQLSENPDTIIKALIRYRGDSRMMPRTSTTLLNQAAAVDPAIKQAYLRADLRIA